MRGRVVPIVNNARILDNERRVQELISKQGRAAQFSSVKERDAWIVEELKSLEATVKAKQKQTDALKAEIADQAERTKEERKALDSRAENAERHKQERDTMNEDFNTLKAKRNQTSDRRKELWRQESEMETEITQHKEGLFLVQASSDIFSPCEGSKTALRNDFPGGRERH